ncbi:hypothetical protein CAPTEDRAFT_201935 [Capitella teleta]|uniref:Uncharacterized protein n=1 Tax=Capitella teleta TaxID=283909 RepID=R7TIK0_CAPTE|nr:hypothetical protein CAPTEDRAFT_201935 [Capitella teleta]|eukprot:ELT91356.1 hypothetical protein CAPTEDRAFT_201935 [Capitella teleta]
MSRKDKYGAAMQFARGQELIIQLPSSGSQIIGTWDGTQFCVGSSLHLHSTPNGNSAESDADENNPSLCNNWTAESDVSAFEGRSPSFSLPVNEKLEDSLHTIRQLHAQVSKLKESNLHLMKETSKLKRDVMTIQEAAKQEVKSQERRMRHLMAENKELKARLAIGSNAAPEDGVVITSESRAPGVAVSDEPTRESTRSLFETIGGLVSEPKAEASHRKAEEGKVLSNLQNMLKSIRSVKASEKAEEPKKKMRRENVKVKAVSNKEMMAVYVSMAEKQTVAKIISAKGMNKVRDNYLSVREQLLTEKEEGMPEGNAQTIVTQAPKLSRTQKRQKRLQETGQGVTLRSSETALNFLSNILHATSSKASAGEEDSGKSSRATSLPTDVIETTARKDTKASDETEVEEKAGSGKVEPEKAMNFLSNIINSTSKPKPPTVENQSREMSAEIRRKVKDPRLRWRLYEEAKAIVVPPSPDPLVAIATGLNIPQAAGFFFKKQSIEPKWKLIELEVVPVLVYHRNAHLKRQLVQAIWSRRDPRKWAPMKKDPEGKRRRCSEEDAEDFKEEKPPCKRNARRERSPGGFAFAEPAVPTEKGTPKKKPPHTDEVLDLANSGPLDRPMDALDDCSMWSMHSMEPPASPTAVRSDDITDSRCGGNKSGLLFNDLYMSDTEDGEASKSVSVCAPEVEVSFQNTLRNSVDNILESLQESDGDERKVSADVQLTPEKIKGNVGPKKFTFGEDILARHSESEYVSPKKKHARCAMETDDDSFMIDLHAPMAEDAELFSQEEDSSAALEFDVGQEQGVSKKIETILETLDDGDAQETSGVKRASIKRVDSSERRRDSRSSRSAEKFRGSKSLTIDDKRRECEKGRRDRRREGHRRSAERHEVAEDLQRRSRDRRSADNSSREKTHSDRSLHRSSKTPERRSARERRKPSDVRNKSPVNRRDPSRRRSKSPRRRRQDARRVIEERSKGRHSSHDNNRGKR